MAWWEIALLSIGLYLLVNLVIFAYLDADGDVALMVCPLLMPLPLLCAGLMVSVGEAIARRLGWRPAGAPEGEGTDGG